MQPTWPWDGPGIGAAVVVRVIPPPAKVQKNGKTFFISADNDRLTVEDKPGSNKLVLEANRIYWSCQEDHPSHSTNYTLFSEIGNSVVQNVLSGYNSCLFSYGQVGSGKTYTFFGDRREKQGLVQLTVGDIFDKIQAIPGRPKICCILSFCETFNEQFRDLCSDDVTNNYTVVDHPILGPVVPQIHEEKTETKEEALEFIAKGLIRRQFGRRTMAKNARSLANTFLTLKTCIESSPGATMVVSLTHFIDLAGFERPSETEQRLKESGFSNSVIAERVNEGTVKNKYMLSLRKHISNLAMAKTWKSWERAVASTPFRESKTTMLMKDALCGNFRTFLIAHMLPLSIHSDGTVSTLKFAESCQKLRFSQKPNEVPAMAAHMLESIRSETVATRKNALVCAWLKSAAWILSLEEQEKTLHDLNLGSFSRKDAWWSPELALSPRTRSPRSPSPTGHSSVLGVRFNGEEVDGDVYGEEVDGDVIKVAQTSEIPIVILEASSQPEVLVIKNFSRKTYVIPEAIPAHVLHEIEQKLCSVRRHCGFDDDDDAYIRPIILVDPKDPLYPLVAAFQRWAGFESGRSLGDIISADELDWRLAWVSALDAETKNSIEQFGGPLSVWYAAGSAYRAKAAIELDHEPGHDVEWMQKRIATLEQLVVSLREMGELGGTVSWTDTLRPIRASTKVFTTDGPEPARATFTTSTVITPTSRASRVARVVRGHSQIEEIYDENYDLWEEVTELRKMEHQFEALKRQIEQDEMDCNEFKRSDTGELKDADCRIEDVRKTEAVRFEEWKSELDAAEMTRNGEQEYAQEMQRMQRQTMDELREYAKNAHVWREKNLNDEMQYSMQLRLNTDELLEAREELRILSIQIAPSYPTNTEILTLDQELKNDLAWENDVQVTQLVSENERFKASLHEYEELLTARSEEYAYKVAQVQAQLNQCEMSHETQLRDCEEALNQCEMSYKIQLRECEELGVAQVQKASSSEQLIQNDLQEFKELFRDQARKIASNEIQIEAKKQDIEKLNSVLANESSCAHRFQAELIEARNDHAHYVERIAQNERELRSENENMEKVQEDAKVLSKMHLQDDYKLKQEFQEQFQTNSEIWSEKTTFLESQLHTRSQEIEELVILREMSRDAHRSQGVAKNELRDRLVNEESSHLKFRRELSEQARNCSDEQANLIASMAEKDALLKQHEQRHLRTASQHRDRLVSVEHKSEMNHFELMEQIAEQSHKRNDLEDKLRKNAMNMERMVAELKVANANEEALHSSRQRGLGEWTAELAKMRNDLETKVKKQLESTVANYQAEVNDARTAANKAKKSELKFAQEMEWMKRNQKINAVRPRLSDESVESVIDAWEGAQAGFGLQIVDLLEIYRRASGNGGQAMPSLTSSIKKKVSTRIPTSNNNGLDLQDNERLHQCQSRHLTMMEEMHVMKTLALENHQVMLDPAT